MGFKSKLQSINGYITTTTTTTSENSGEGGYTWFKREKEALVTKEIPEGKRRVVVVRHGMGYHNDWYGAGCAFNRDASLNPAGREQVCGGGCGGGCGGYGGIVCS